MTSDIVMLEVPQVLLQDQMKQHCVSRSAYQGVVIQVLAELGAQIVFYRCRW